MSQIRTALTVLSVPKSWDPVFKTDSDAWKIFPRFRNGLDHDDRRSLQKKCISATHICNASCVAETICNALCVAEFAMQKTGLQIFCNASQRSVAEICNAKAVAV